MLKRLFEARGRRSSLYKYGYYEHLEPQLKRLFHLASLNLKAKSYYETLELTSNATQAQIKAAYYRLSMLHHPDKSQGQIDIDNKFQAITEAYETLSNVDKRRNYDRGIMVHSPKTGAAEGRRTGQEGIIKNRPQNYGRSEHYNFDEFYKMHYGSTLRRRHTVKMEYEAFLRAQAQKQEPASFVALTVGAVLLLILAVSLAPNPYDKPPEQHPKSS